MALLQLMMQPPVIRLAAGCRLQATFSSILRPHMGTVYSRSAIRGLSDSLTANQKIPVISVISKHGIFTRFLGHTFSRVQAKRYVHQTFILQVKNKLPFEVDGNVRRDTLIFSFRNDTLFRMITFFGITQFFFWVYMGFVTDVTLKRFNIDEKEATTFSHTILRVLKDYSSKLSGACILLGNVVLFFTILYPKRSIRSLTLLKGGKNLKLVTYSYFGKTIQFNVPLEEVSCMQSRNSKGATLAMKIKGHWWYYMLDKRKGTFHQTELFDHVVGLQRELKK